MQRYQQKVTFRRQNVAAFKAKLIPAGVEAVKIIGIIRCYQRLKLKASQVIMQMICHKQLGIGIHGWTA